MSTTTPQNDAAKPAAIDKKVSNALNRNGYKVGDLDDAQRQRALDAPTVKAGLTGKALANYVVSGESYPPEDRAVAEAKKAADAQKAKSTAAARRPSAASSGASSRPRYPDDIRAAVKLGCDVSKGKASTSPGAQDHAAIRTAVAKAMGGEPGNAGALLAWVTVSRKDLGRIATAAAKGDEALKPARARLAEIAALSADADGKIGTWRRGKHTATILAVWHDQLAAAA